MDIFRIPKVHRNMLAIRFSLTPSYPTPAGVKTRSNIRSISAFRNFAKVSKDAPLRLQTSLSCQDEPLTSGCAERYPLVKSCSTVSGNSTPYSIHFTKKGLHTVSFIRDSVKIRLELFHKSCQDESRKDGHFGLSSSALIWRLRAGNSKYR